MQNRFQSYLQSLQRVTSSNSFIPEIDGLRFYAIITIVLLHTNTLLTRQYNDSLGAYIGSEIDEFFLLQDVGVKFFFIISGFILSLPFLKKNRSFSYKKYFIRRLTRLEPPFLVSIILIYLIQLFASDTIAPNVGHFFATIAYHHVIIYGDWSAINPVTWSLETEFQFYVIAPMMGVLFFHLVNKRARVIFLTIIIVLWYQFIRPPYVHLDEFNLHKSLAYYLPYFLTGYLLALNSSWLLNSTLHFFWDFAGMLALFLIYYFHPYVSDYSIFGLLGMGILFIAAFKGVFLNMIFRNRILTTIGGMCYSIYLLHYALIFILVKLIPFQVTTKTFPLSIIIVLVTVLVISSIFYKYFERPFMFKNWWTDLRIIWDR